MKRKVTYELVTDLNTNEIAIAMIKGEVFYNSYGTRSYRWEGTAFVDSNNDVVYLVGEFYRRIETPVEWWEDLDSLKFPIALVNKKYNEMSSFTKEELKCNMLFMQAGEWRPATKAEIQVLLDNAPE